MKRLGLALALYLSLMGWASAQGGMAPGPGTVHSTGGSYTGPGDVVSGAVFWVSCSRGYNAADTANACNVCLPADTTCADITLTNGFAVLPGSLSTCNITTVICTVKTAYDKSGNGRNATQATEANRPTFRPAMASNGCPTTALPCMLLTAANSPRLVTAAFSQAQPFTWSTVINSSANNGDLLAWSGTVGLLRFGANSMRMAASGAFDFAVSDNAHHAVQSAFNGASSSAYVDGSGGTGNAGTAGASSLAFQFSQSAFIGYGTFYISEVGIWPSAFTCCAAGSESQLMNANQHGANGYNF